MTSILRWLVVAGAAAWPFLLDSPAAHRRGIELCVLVLAGLALAPTTGWLRCLALHIPACIGVGALAATAVLRVQGLPLAVAAGCAAGAVLGVVVALARPRIALVPVVGLAVSAVVASVAMPALRLGPVSRPVVLGIDLGAERALYLAALGLVVACWLGIQNLARARPGWQMRTVGMAPGLAARSGMSVGATWRGGFLLSGAVAGLAGVVLVLLGQGLPSAAEVGPARAVALLAIPLVGGQRGPDGAVLGAVLLWLGALLASAAGVVEAELAAGGMLVALALLVRPGRGLAELVHQPRASARIAR